MALIRITDLDDLVSKCKTKASKKALLTREIKALKEQSKEVEKAFEKRPKGSVYGWYLGDKIYHKNVTDSKVDVRIVEKYKAKLDE